VLSPDRLRAATRPRLVAMYLAHVLSTLSLPEIGHRLGDRHHTTVLHAIRTIEQEMGEDPHFREEVADLQRRLTAQAGAAPGGAIHPIRASSAAR
jgi:chromosomal replication initiator protein